MTEGPAATNQAEIDRKNAEFWDELCGTQLAQSLGITDFSAESLAKFDRYYLDIYPYLSKYLALEALAGKDVLEIGLGYGTVAQMLAAHSRNYTGLDIAGGPVAVVNQRLSLFGLRGTARQGNILEAPFESNRFDAVVTIGCLHHTGNLPRALAEVHRVLRPGGTALVMIYNALSYRRWWNAPGATWRTFRQDYFGSSVDHATSASERAAYDRDRSGAAAPATVFTSARRLRALCSHFSSVVIHKENAEQEPPFSRLRRTTLLPILGPALGLDLYATLRK